jgi:glycosyltransferase involved in cell wall biosynthesis
MSNPKFTIVTPTYNREDLVQITIHSIINQTFKDWELIIVDDGSTDNTEEIIQKYLEDPRIRYIKKANSGQAHSLNVGASHAKGDFITFLDSDDEAYSNWLEVVNANIKEDTPVVCVGAIRKLIDGSKIREGLGAMRISGKIIRLKFTCGSLFIKRSIFSAIGGYDAELKSNIQTDLGYRLVAYLEKLGTKIVAVDDYLVQINIHTGPRIRTNWEKRRIGGMQFLKKHYDFIYENNRDEISDIYAVIAFSNYKLRQRRESIRYLLKAIRVKPYTAINYLRVLKYALFQISLFMPAVAINF